MQNQTLKVKVKIPNGDILEYEVSPFDTMQSLRTKLKESQGVDEKDQQLGVYEGIKQSPENRSFLPSCTFEEASVKDGDLLYYAIRKGGHKLFVKMPDGKIEELDPDTCDTIAYIKGLIQEKTGHAVEKQTVIFAGKRLENHRIVADYGVQKESTLQLILQE